MDIRNWPLANILQLPSSCFGRKFPIFCYLDMAAGETKWDISELALPEKTVIHELVVMGGGAFSKVASCRIALGDQLPTATAMVDALEPLMPGLGLQGVEPRVLDVWTLSVLHLTELRLFVQAAGRRLVLEAVTITGMVLAVTVCIVVSPLPTEVPDCLLSV